MAREPLMTVKETAAFLHITTQVVYDLINAEKVEPGSGLVASNIGTGRQTVYRIRPRDADRFLDSRRSAA